MLNDQDWQAAWEKAVRVSAAIAAALAAIALLIWVCWLLLPSS